MREGRGGIIPRPGPRSPQTPPANITLTCGFPGLLTHMSENSRTSREKTLELDFHYSGQKTSGPLASVTPSRFVTSGRWPESGDETPSVVADSPAAAGHSDASVLCSVDVWGGRDRRSPACPPSPHAAFALRVLPRRGAQLPARRASTSPPSPGGHPAALLPRLPTVPPLRALLLLLPRRGLVLGGR